jgi:hypothetical protein
VLECSNSKLLVRSSEETPVKVIEHASPRAHVVVDDLLAPGELDELRAQVRAIAPLRRIGYMGGPVLYRDRKRNRTIEVPASFVAPRRRAPLLASLEARIWGSELRERLRHSRSPIYSILDHCHAPRLHVSWYGDGDHYGRHQDNNPPSNLTLLFLLGRDPPRFRGGRFVLTHDGATKSHAFKGNRLIIFPSDTHHEVTPVRTTSEDPEDLRVSVQIWPALGPRPLANRETKDVDAAQYVHEFRVPSVVWDGLAAFQDLVHARSSWRGDERALGIFETPRAVLAVLVANVKYVVRRLFPHLRAAPCQVAFAPHVVDAGECARVACRVSSDGVSISSGYIVRRLPGEFELRLFVAVRAHGATARELQTGIAVDADAEQTISAVRRLHGRALRACPGLRGPARARLTPREQP